MYDCIIMVSIGIWRISYGVREHWGRVVSKEKETPACLDLAAYPAGMPVLIPEGQDSADIGVEVSHIPGRMWSF